MLFAICVWSDVWYESGYILQVGGRCFHSIGQGATNNDMWILSFKSTIINTDLQVKPKTLYQMYFELGIAYRYNYVLCNYHFRSIIR